MRAYLPLTVLPLIAFNLIGFGAGGAPWELPLLTVAMPSGVAWQPTVGDALAVFGVVVLVGEIFRVARSPAARSALGRIVSAGVAALYLIEIAMVGAAANSVFMLLTVCALAAVVAAGFRPPPTREPDEN